MKTYTDCNIHQRINYKGNLQIKGICFGNSPKNWGAIISHTDIFNVPVYMECAVMDFTRRKGDRPAKYSQSQFNNTVKPYAIALNRF